MEVTTYDLISAFTDQLSDSKRGQTDPMVFLGRLDPELSHSIGNKR